MLISPALAGVADRSGLGLWVIPVAIPGPARNAIVEPQGLRLETPEVGPFANNADLTDRLAAAESALRQENKTIPGLVEVRTVRDPAPIRAPRRTGRPFVGGFIFIWAVGVLMGMARTVGGLATRGGAWRGRLRTLMGRAMVKPSRLNAEILADETVPMQASIISRTTPPTRQLLSLKFLLYRRRLR